MYVILVYDVAQERTSRALKTCRRYLHWIQNSVFEGELSEAQLKALQKELTQILDTGYDSVIIFHFRQEKWVERTVIGREKGDTGNIL